MKRRVVFVSCTLAMLCWSATASAQQGQYQSSFFNLSQYLSPIQFPPLNTFLQLQADTLYTQSTPVSIASGQTLVMTAASGQLAPTALQVSAIQNLGVLKAVGSIDLVNTDNSIGTLSVGDGGTLEVTGDFQVDGNVTLLTGANFIARGQTSVSSVFESFGNSAMGPVAPMPGWPHMPPELMNLLIQNYQALSSEVYTGGEMTVRNSTVNVNPALTVNAGKYAVAVSGFAAPQFGAIYVPAGTSMVPDSVSYTKSDGTAANAYLVYLNVDQTMRPLPALSNNHTLDAATTFTTGVPLAIVSGQEVSMSDKTILVVSSSDAATPSLVNAGVLNATGIIDLASPGGSHKLRNEGTLNLTGGTFLGGDLDSPGTVNVGGQTMVAGAFAGPGAVLMGGVSPVPGWGHNGGDVLMGGVSPVPGWGHEPPDLGAALMAQGYQLTSSYIHASGDVTLNNFSMTFDAAYTPKAGKYVVALSDASEVQALPTLLPQGTTLRDPEFKYTDSQGFSHKHYLAYLEVPMQFHGAGNVTAEATSAAGANVGFAVSADDTVFSMFGSDAGKVTVNCTPASGSLFPLGASQVTCNGTDTKGTTGTTSFTVSVADTTLPSLFIPSGISATATGQSLATVTYSATATDLVDGTDKVSCTPASGSSFAAGSTRVNCTATDSHGNTATGSFLVQVNYNFTGFLAPVEMAPTVNAIKAGSAVPVKFSLGGNQGLGVMSAGTVAVTCGTVDAMDNVVLDTVAAASSSLSYDPASDQYTYVWKTDKSWAGTCRQLQVKLNDGSTKIAQFRLK